MTLFTVLFFKSRSKVYHKLFRSGFYAFLYLLVEHIVWGCTQYLVGGKYDVN